MKTHCFILALIVLPWLTSACGSNVFVLAESQPTAERAAALLDQKKSDEAIDLLDTALVDAPDDWILVSLMASAKAQKAGLDTTDIALKMAAQASSGSNTSSNPLINLFSITPQADATALAYLLEAINYLESIPVDQRVRADLLKASLISTAYTAMQVRLFDSNGDGQFSVSELENLTDEQASAIISTLISAQSSAESYKSANGSESSADTVTSIATQIQAQSGATNADKLRNYLGTSG